MAVRKTREEQRVEEIKKALESGGRILPNNFDAEQAVLGCALIDSEAALTIVGKLEELDFYNDTHKKIFAAIKRLYANSAPIDFVTVSDELEKDGYISDVGGMAYISSLSNIVPSAASANHYINILKRDFSGNQIIIASIFQYDFDSVNLVEIKNRLIE